MLRKGSPPPGLQYIFLIIFLDKVVKLVGGGSVINGATPSSFPITELSC